jgi:2-phosphosulfolactate phosphatase
MRVHVAFTPGEAARVPIGIVVDVLRATSTIVQALDAGYRTVYCCAEIEEARALRDELGDAILGGERGGDPLPGFDLGNSPLEYLSPMAEEVVLTTTNGTRAVVGAAANCDHVLVGSMLNLDAVAATARGRGEDVEVVCAGLRGGPSEDDAYCAGRIAALLGGSRPRRRSGLSSWQRPTRLPRRRFAPSEGSGRPSPRKTWSGAHARASALSSLGSTACAEPPRGSWPRRSGRGARSRRDPAGAAPRQSPPRPRLQPARVRGARRPRPRRARRR